MTGFSQQLQQQQQELQVSIARRGKGLCEQYSQELFFFFFVRQISSHPGALVHSPPTLYPRHAGRSYLSLLVSAACCADWGSVSPKLNCHVISSTPALPLRPGLSVRQQDGHANYPPLRTHLFPLTPKAVLSGNVSDGSWYKTGSKG